MPSERSPVYLEPIQDYLTRKHFRIGLASSSLILLLVVDSLFFREMTWSVSTYAFHGILLGIGAALLFMERHVWSYRRLRIDEDGFVLAGRQTLPNGRRVVRFGQIMSAEAVAADGGVRKTLLYLTIRVQPGVEGSSGVAVGAQEVVITREELSHRNIVQLWGALVRHGLGREDVLRWMDSTA